MVRIGMNQNDRGLLLRILENYKNYRYKDYDDGKITVMELNYDLENLKRIVNAINGIVKEDYQQVSKTYREKIEKTKGENDVKTPWAPLPYNKR